MPEFYCEAFKVDANGLPLLDTYNNSDLSPDDTKTPVDPRLDLAIGRTGVTWKDYTESPYEITWARKWYTLSNRIDKIIF